MPALFLHPSQPLRKYIYRYVHCEIGSAEQWSTSSMSPPGYAKLAVVLQTNQVLAKENGRSARNFSPITFVGQVTKFIPFAWYGRITVFFVIFQPFGAFPLIGVPQDECKNVPIGFNDLVDKQGQHLADSISPQLKAGEVRKIIDQYFLKRLAHHAKKQTKHRYQSRRLSKAVEKIQLSIPKDLSIKEICRETGYSMSTLERHMKKIVGITPKQFQRVIRFNRTMQFIKHLPSHPNWPQVAQQFGYYDQTHFIKEFKHFNGQTPSAFLDQDPHFLGEI
ncbi:MAG: helix-turn-helix domain-containing protein [Bacteroidota bacterium]